MKINRRNSTILICALCAAFIFLAGFVLGKIVHNSTRNPDEEGVSCTMEAKICPDSSAVGREGRNCEFPECPDKPAAKQ
ncbi:MAG: hypothetical protein U0520_03705 [Candidatus Saccharimonadales bacterium]